MIESLGGQIGRCASSQQPVDIQDVQWPDGEVCSYECKKLNTGSSFHFNDTFIKDDVYYILIYVKLHKIRMAKGTLFIKESLSEDKIPYKKHIKNIIKMLLDMYDEDICKNKIKEFFKEVILFIKCCVLNGFVTYFDFGELFKQHVSFGSFYSRPRPNWILTIPYKPPSQSVEEPHFQVE